MSQSQILINVLQCYTVKSLAQDTSENSILMCNLAQWNMIRY